MSQFRPEHEFGDGTYKPTKASTLNTCLHVHCRSRLVSNFVTYRP